MSKPKPPSGLASGGRTLWREVVKDHDLDAVQLVTPFPSHLMAVDDRPPRD